MRICLVGNYYPGRPLDEGMAKVGFYLCQELSKRHDILHSTVKRVFSTEFWRKIVDFHPQIVHYIPGTSIRNLLLIKILKFYCGRAKIIISVQQPNFSAFTKILIPCLKPDLVLVQSLRTERIFTNSGCRAEFLPNGVDGQRFITTSSEVKRTLRVKYQVDTTKSIVLHVGPLRKWRNIDILSKVQQQGDNQVIAVASITNPSEEKACQQLKQAGCMVWRAYFKNIEEIYALSNYYIFPPTYKLGSIETPLSVMEAMSCNLPVISTRYGALPRLFTEGDGLYFSEREEELIPLLERVKTENREIKTREKVLDYTWGNVAKSLERIYSEVLKE